MKRKAVLSFMDSKFSTQVREFVGSNGTEAYAKALEFVSDFNIRVETLKLVKV